jgi:hypothetical protein
MNQHVVRARLPVRKRMRNVAGSWSFLTSNKITVELTVEEKFSLKNDAHNDVTMRPLTIWRHPRTTDVVVPR